MSTGIADEEKASPVDGESAGQRHGTSGSVQGRKECIALPMVGMGGSAQTGSGSGSFGDGLSGTNASASLTGPCGDTMQFDLRIDGERVVDVRFQGRGCRHSRLCGLFVAETAKGKTLDELPEITAEYITGHLPGLPSEEGHCARLAYETLMEAVDRYFTEVVKKGKGR